MPSSPDSTPGISAQNRAAAHILWSRVPDRSAHTAPARKAFRAKFEREVDPEGKLSPAERSRRAGHLRKAYYIRLAALSAKARRRKAGGDAA
jgi:hypothetical protein